MGIRAEHDSLEVFLKGALSDDARRRVLFVSFTQWGFALAGLADTTACLHRMGSEPVLAFWSGRTPMLDTGSLTDRRVARLLFSPAPDDRVKEALLACGIPRSSLAKPPIRRWRPRQDVAIARPMNRSEIKALEYFGSPMGRAVLQVRTLTDTPVTDAYYWPQRLLQLAARSYAYAYDQTAQLIRDRSITAVAVYNGRFLHDRAASAAAQAAGVPVLYYDTGGIDTDFDLTDNVTHDWTDLQRRMLSLYDSWPEDERDEVGGSWFTDRLNHKAPDNALFVEAQQRGTTIERPDTKCLVAYFSSSGDEIAELELDWTQFIGDQPEVLKLLADQCRGKDGYTLVVRSHPHKRMKPKLDVEEWLAAVADADPDIHIDQHSPIDSYELMRQADIVVTYGSTTGVEAAFAGKPVIVLGPSAYDELGCAVLPHTAEELSRALDNTEPGSWPGAVSYGLMMRRRGFNYESVVRLPGGGHALGGHAFEDSRPLARHISHLLGRVERWRSTR